MRVAIADSGDASSAAKAAQNPLANMISVPFEDEANLNAGPDHQTLNVLNIEPVIPFTVSDQWNIITRTIVPLVSSPPLDPGDRRTTGSGDLLFSAFLSPHNPGEWIWGVGPAIQAPTHSDPTLGNHNWGLGPTVAVLHISPTSRWVYGILFENDWSVGNRYTPAYNNGLVQMFVNYNLDRGLYLVYSPIITVNWKAQADERWTVPIGGGIGKILIFGHVPVNLQLSAYYNLENPTFGPNWQIRTHVEFLFPK